MCLGTKVSFSVFTSFIKELPAAHCLVSLFCFLFEFQTGSIYVLMTNSFTTTAWKHSVDHFAEFYRIYFLLLLRLTSTVNFFHAYDGYSKQHEKKYLKS